MANDELDPLRFEKIVPVIEQIADGLRITIEQSDKFGRSIKNIHEEIDKKVLLGFGKMRKSFNETTDAMGTRYKHFVQVEFLRGTEDALNKAQSKWKAYGEEVKRHMREARGALGGAGGAMGLSGDKGIAAGASNAASSIMGNLPFGMGGIIGMMLYGKMREKEFEAAGFRAARIFDQIGGAGRNVAAQNEGVVRKMNYAWGSMGDELVGVNAALAHVGITGRQSIEPVAGYTTKWGNAFNVVTMGLAEAYKMDPGKLAQMMGSVFEAGGTERQALIGDFASLASAANNTGVNVERLMSTMTQSASALRVQRQGVGDLAGAYVKLYSSFVSQGSFKSKAAAGTAAMSGVQAAASGIGGMSEGLSAYLGQRMGGGTGVNALVNFQLGMSGKGDFAGKVFEQLGQLAKERTGNGTRNEQIFALEKLAPSLGVEGARAVVDMKSGGATLKDVQAALKPAPEKLLDAFNRRSREESAWEKVQRQIMLNMATIGSSLLTITMSGLDLLVTSVRALMPGGTVTGTDVTLAANKFAKIEEKEIGKMIGAVIGMGMSAGNAVDLMPNRKFGVGPNATAKAGKSLLYAPSSLAEATDAESMMGPAREKQNKAVQAEMANAVHQASSWPGYDKMSLDQKAVVNRIVAEGRAGTKGRVNQEVAGAEAVRGYMSKGFKGGNGVQVIDDTEGALQIIVRKGRYKGEGY